MEESKCEQKLPGFRFHPTEEELLNFYLKSMVFGKKLRGDVIGFLNIYNYDPKDLPRLAKTGEREWYFFVPRDRKHGGGGRPNRTTAKGFWKATGSDRQIPSVSDPKKILGLKKTLVFYEGRAPRGRKTNWIMNEYRLPDKCSAPTEIVLCKIYMKATSLKVLEQRAAMEGGAKTFDYSLSSPMDAALSSDSFCSLQFEEEGSCSMMNKGLKREREKVEVDGERAKRGCSSSSSSSSSSIVLPSGLQNLGELQVPKLSMDWTQDSFWAQFNLSPWLDNFTPFLPMC